MRCCATLTIWTICPSFCFLPQTIWSAIKPSYSLYWWHRPIASLSPMSSHEVLSPFLQLPEDNPWAAQWDDSEPLQSADSQQSASESATITSSSPYSGWQHSYRMAYFSITLPPFLSEIHPFIWSSAHILCSCSSDYSTLFSIATTCSHKNLRRSREILHSLFFESRRLFFSLSAQHFRWSDQKLAQEWVHWFWRQYWWDRWVAGRWNWGTLGWDIDFLFVI